MFALQASILFENCDKMHDFSASATATTAYGIPEKIKNAKVVNDTNSGDCVIEWEHNDYYDENVLKYKVS